MRERVRSDGGVSYQISFVAGGGRAGQGRPEQSETFTSKARALAFKADVEEAGENWPTRSDGVPWVRGEGYVVATIDTPPTKTVHDVAQDYFGNYQPQRVKVGKLTPYTLQRDRRTYTLHMSEQFGGMDIAEIKSPDIVAWILEQLDEEAKPKSIRNRHGLLHSILKHGQLRMSLRADNPALESSWQLPVDTDVDRRQTLFFSHPEWALLRDSLARSILLLVDLAVATGMRWGEISALRCGDISFDRDGTARINIVRAWSVRAAEDKKPIRRDESETVKWRLGLPKGGKTRRNVVRGELAERLRRATQFHPVDTYLFRTRPGGPWRYEAFYRQHWKAARLEAEARGLRKHATIHMLRHTFVVWSLEAGADLQKVSDNVGHASVSLTWRIYGGMLNTHDPALADAMAKELGYLDGLELPPKLPDDVRAATRRLARSDR